SAAGLTLLRRLLSRAGSLYARVVLGLAVRDLTGGFKRYTREALDRVLLRLAAVSERIRTVAAERRVDWRRIVGLYVGRIFEQAKERREFLVFGRPLIGEAGIEEVVEC